MRIAVVVTVFVLLLLGAVLFVAPAAPVAGYTIPPATNTPSDWTPGPTAIVSPTLYCSGSPCIPQATPTRSLTPTPENESAPSAPPPQMYLPIIGK